MQLTHYTDYALRVLIFLSLQARDERITVNGIAEHFNIPRNHLVKIVHHLGQLGYVHTTRGKNGGICLGRVAEQICIGDVVRNMEARLDIVDCDTPSPCPIKPQCRLKQILQQAAGAFLDVLDQYSIADLQRSPETLKKLLHW